MNEELRESARENLGGQYVGGLKLTSFRNYAALDLVLDPGLNILFGQNAQGKTNLLEALYLLSTTRLLRGSKDAEAILQGKTQARIEAELCPSRTELAVVLEAGRKKVVQLNKLKLPRAADLIGRVPCVCVSAFDAAIIRGGPDDRRLFLDLELSQLSPSYLNHLAHYKRALEQRNALLRRAQEEQVSSAEFEPWEETLATHGAPLRSQRAAMVHELEAPVDTLQQDLASGEHLELHYETKDTAETPDALLRSMQESRSRDIQRGASSIGPHRDDLSLVVQGRDARHFGSQGQQRTAVLALKLATHMRQTQIRGEAPLLLLDDILSDLDERRRKRLVEWLLDHARQAVLTCTEPEAAGGALLERATHWRVQNGTVSKP